MRSLDLFLAWVVIRLRAVGCFFGYHVPRYLKLRKASRQVRRNSGFRLIANGAECAVCGQLLGGSRA